jgi:hypothetical protein
VINEIILLMQDLYFDEGSARSVLIGIGYPPARIPAFRQANVFWADVVLQLDRGTVLDGIGKLLAAVVADYPANSAAKDLLARWEAENGAPANGTRAAAAPGSPRVLGLYADPGNTLRLGFDMRLLTEIAERDGFYAYIQHAARVTDIIRAILTKKPNILHFSGHGTSKGRLVFEREDGSAGIVGPAALAAAIKAASAEVLDCVVLNACFTGQHAAAFSDVTRSVAGSVEKIPDDGALAFTRGFYTGLGAGQKAPEAFRTAEAQMQLEQYDTKSLHFVSFP